MKIIVLGGGVIGVTTAYYLAKAGHEVIVIERQNGVALETSFANAGEISPGYASPWAAPGIPLKALKWLFMRHSPLIIRPHLDPLQWRWAASMLRNCTASRYAVNKSRMVRLAEYSRDVLRNLRLSTAISYDEQTRGTLEIFRTQKQFDAIAKDLTILDRFDVPYQVLDREGCVSQEPGLRPSSEKFVGGLRLPTDETGDCFMFTNKLAAMSERLGVVFRFETAIDTISSDGDVVTEVGTSQGPLTADAVVVALGSYSPRILRPLGIDIPVYPVKGYSITAPIIDKAMAPVSTVMDETHKIAITRLGNRVRAAGMAELDGFDLSLQPLRRETIEYVVGDLFSNAADLTKSEFWTGLRPMTPDGTPVLGGTRYRNLYLNTGHGTLGWTMACGSGRIVADLISGRSPDIDIEGLTMSRYTA